MFARIRWQLVAWTMLVVGLILVALGVAVYVALSRNLLDQVDRNLATQADLASTNPRGILGGPGERERDRFRGGLFYLIVDPRGQVLANPQGVDAGELDLARVASQPRVPLSDSIGGESVRLYGHPMGRPPEGRGPGPGFGGSPAKPGPPPGFQAFDNAVVVVGQSLVGEERALGSLLLIMITCVGLGLLLSFGGAWFLAGRALVPIQLAFRRQQEFVADASHELRTPLTVLRSATDLLNQHRDQPLAQNGELFDDVRGEIGRLQRLTQDLLTLARSDRGELELATAPLDIRALAQDVVRRTAPLAGEQGVELSCDCAGDGPTVEADPDRLQQVLLILIDNAIKHTPVGGRVDVAVRPIDGHVAVEVADTGAGIAPEYLPRIFERFYRADAARTRDGGGTGLGLAIARSLVEAHRGDITIASTLGVGTRVTVRLPTAAHASLAERIGCFATRITHRPVR
jgi:signal transduction histidine kinase